MVQVEVAVRRAADRLAGREPEVPAHPLGADVAEVRVAHGVPRVVVVVAHWSLAQLDVVSQAKLNWREEIERSALS